MSDPDFVHCPCGTRWNRAAIDACPMCDGTGTRAPSRFRAATKDEFDAFVQSYPRPLTRDVETMGEPPKVSLNDFTLGDWPKSVVASVTKWSDSYPNADGSKRPDTYAVADLPKSA